ncbi:acyl carrier protein [Pedobacter cryoconitis]|uniref:acyl carrier protein n=1 Tax=Pedobacter cryoconitis TaxID=188932 RepID=UPI00179607DB|nr:acyl carrier protein [Pedobacter cryoconitis]MBB6274404.1 acyl carrier protein [Pedobacter cryoconitis]
MSPKLQEILSTALALPADQITDDLAYQSVPEWDSMSHMILIAELESNYSITIETEDLLEMTDVTNVITGLKKYGVEA